MKIEEIRQNLFDLDVKYYLGHCISSDFAMGAGIAEKIASLLSTYDVDENICKKVNYCNEDMDDYDCVDCIIDFFSKDCEWNHDDVCVNDQSDWCADFVDSVKCGRCKYFER